MRLISYLILLVANYILYAWFKYIVKFPLPNEPYRRSCLKKPMKPDNFVLGSVNAYAKAAKKTVLKLTGKAKKVKIQATPTKSIVVFRWIDKKKDCFHRSTKRRRAPKR